MAKLSSKFYRYWMFILGIIATVAYRIIVVLNHYNPLLVQIAWYAGTIGFVWYFAHRFKIENRRDILITDLKLTKKIEDGVSLNKTEKDALVYILRGLQTSLSKWNYVAIFILSTIALAYGFYQDFLLSIL
ncbi:MAG TPA: hypothetical protein VFD51_00205 [Patescibacteria group bacterium]|nr:hypothetical protein [Patescibacteria group bacterium]